MVSQVPWNSYGAAVIGVSWMETAIATILISLRLYTRFGVTRSTLGADDVFMIFSGLLVIASAAANTVAAEYGFGYHYINLTGSQFSRTILMEMVCETTMLIGIITSKCSVALFLLRFFIKPWQKWVLWFIMVTLAIVCLFTALVNWFQCSPVDFAWSTRQGPGSCWINISTPSIVAGVWSALVDFTLAGLPWIVVYSLDIRKKEKLTIAISLSLGAVAGVCGIIRTYELKQLESSLDYTYATVPTLLWALSELVITIVAANIPCLRPLYNKVRGRSQTGRSATLSPTEDANDRMSKNDFTDTFTSSKSRRTGSQVSEELGEMPLRSNPVRPQPTYGQVSPLWSHPTNSIHIKEEVDISRQPITHYMQ